MRQWLYVNTLCFIFWGCLIQLGSLHMCLNMTTQSPVCNLVATIRGWSFSVPAGRCPYSHTVWFTHFHVCKLIKFIEQLIRINQWSQTTKLRTGIGLCLIYYQARQKEMLFIRATQFSIIFVSSITTRWEHSWIENSVCALVYKSLYILHQSIVWHKPGFYQNSNINNIGRKILHFLLQLAEKQANGKM